MHKEESHDDLWRPHVTVATVAARDDRFLMVEEIVRGELRINQPAGHLEPDESLLDAALRETLEETGWTVELTALLGACQWRSPASGTHYLRFAFAAEPRSHDAARPLDTGIVRAPWLTRAEIAARAAQLRSPLVLANIDDFIAGRRLPLDAIRTFAP